MLLADRELDALGADRDLAGGFGPVLWVLVAAAAVLVLVDASFSRERLRVRYAST